MTKQKKLELLEKVLEKRIDKAIAMRNENLDNAHIVESLNTTISVTSDILDLVKNDLKLQYACYENGIETK